MKFESRPEPKAIASLIYWSSAAEKERIERWIKKLQEQGFVDAEPIRAVNGKTDRINLVTTRSELGMALRELVALDLFV